MSRESIDLWPVFWMVAVLCVAVIAVVDRTYTLPRSCVEHSTP